MYLEITGHPYLIFNGIFGMAKGSKFLKFALETIKLNYEQTPDYTARWVPARTGPVFFTSVFVSWSQIGDFLTCRITGTILWSSNKHDWGGISGGEIRQIFHLPGLISKCKWNFVERYMSQMLYAGQSGREIVTFLSNF